MSQESPYAEVLPPVQGSKETEAEEDKVTVKNGTKDATFKFLVGFFGLLFFVLIVILLIYVMVRLNVVDKRMGGLHGDMDRDLKDTNLIVLSNDVAKLHARMETLMAALKAQSDKESRHIAALLTNKTEEINTNLAQHTNDIDSSILSLSKKVDSETQEIDTSLTNMTIEMEKTKTELVNKITTNHDKIVSETDEIDRSLGTIKLELENKTTAISDALEEQKNRLSQFQNEAGVALKNVNETLVSEAAATRSKTESLANTTDGLTTASKNEIIKSLHIGFTQVSDLDAAILGNLSAATVTIGQEFGDVKSSFFTVNKNLTQVEAEISSAETSILTRFDTNITRLSARNTLDKEAVLEALKSSNVSLQSSVDTVDTLVDQIASSLGKPSNVQGSVFQEFEQMQKGKQILMYTTWGNGFDIVSQLQNLEAKWKKIFTNADKTIQLTLYAAGEVVAEYYFEGNNTTPFTWFDKSKLYLVAKGPNLLLSTATGLPSDDVGVYFDIYPDRPSIQGQRMFYVNNNFGGCPQDAGWLLVLNKNDQCNPDWFPGKKLVYPMIAYSKKADGSHTKWNNASNVGFADTLMVSTINI